jgi:predicted metal-dependent hydrolase
LVIYYCGVQLRLPRLRLAGVTKAPAQRFVEIDGTNVPVTVTRHRLARRYVVRVAEDGGLRLTVPRGASLAGGFAFAERQADWITREMERQRLRRVPWVTGTRAWFRGEQMALRVSGSSATIGSEIIRVDDQHNVRTAVEKRLRAMASAELPERCRELAERAGVKVASVSVRNQRSRWGACSSRRVITLNWRLIQMPATVRDYVIFHELMHIRHPNHSRRFWREVEGVCAWWRDAERWLRVYGRELLP